MSDDLNAELERLGSKNAALKKVAATGVTIKVGRLEYRLSLRDGRFPDTLYKTRWRRLLATVDVFRTFIAAHEACLKTNG